MLTEKELIMYHAKGEKIRVKYNDGTTVEGYCEVFTQPLDNDPEIASICVTRGFDKKAALIEITEPEIETIDYLD